MQSPSSDEIAFTRVYPNHMELWTVNTDTHRLAHVGTAAGQLFPTWLSNGDLAYASGGTLWVAHPNGTGKHRYPAPKGATAPAARPASGQLAYVVGGKLEVDGAVWATDVLGRPTWSPDGKTLAFRRDDGIYEASDPGVVSKVFGVLNPGDPVWSTSGAMLAFAANGTVWVAGPGATPAYAAARNRPDASAPAWTGDNRRLAFSWRGGVDEILLPTHATHVVSSAGVGVSYSAEGILEYSGPRATCPGHFGIVMGGRLETGSCAVTGTSHADVIEGTPLWGDVISGGAGNDQIHANDGHTDRVNCGPGHDTVWADRTDKLIGCEVVHR